MRVLPAMGFVFGVTFAAAHAKADVDLVVDPGPPITASPLVVGDFAEGVSSINENYRFSGTAHNGANVSLTLLVSSRANGTVISGSERSFSLPANGSTPFTYDFTWLGHPSPATVGLQFRAPDGDVSFVGGVFHAAPAAPAQVTAITSPALAMLAAGFIRIGARSISHRRTKKRAPVAGAAQDVSS